MRFVLSCLLAAVSSSFEKLVPFWLWSCLLAYGPGNRVGYLAVIDVVSVRLLSVCVLCALLHFLFCMLQLSQEYRSGMPYGGPVAAAPVVPGGVAGVPGFAPVFDDAGMAAYSEAAQAQLMSECSSSTYYPPCDFVRVPYSPYPAPPPMMRAGMVVPPSFINPGVAPPRPFVTVLPSESGDDGQHLVPTSSNCPLSKDGRAQESVIPEKRGTSPPICANSGSSRSSLSSPPSSSALGTVITGSTPVMTTSSIPPVYRDGVVYYNGVVPPDPRMVYPHPPTLVPSPPYSTMGMYPLPTFAPGHPITAGPPQQVMMPMGHQPYPQSTPASFLTPNLPGLMENMHLSCMAPM